MFYHYFKVISVISSQRIINLSIYRKTFTILLLKYHTWSFTVMLKILFIGSL